MGEGGAIRAFLLSGALVKSISKECLLCEETTKGGKDFCSKHVLYMPYAKKIQDNLAIAEDRAREKRKKKIRVLKGI